VLGIDLEDRLCDQPKLPGSRQKALELTIHPALRGNKAHGTFGQPLGRSHIRHLISEGGLAEAMKRVTASDVLAAFSPLPSRSGTSARSAPPCVTDFNGLPS
jgi:hypothetical protein